VAFGHDAAWWEAKAGQELAEGGLSPSTWVRWAEAESRELGAGIHADTRNTGVSPFHAVARCADLQAEA
jgi:hypothetical protein